MNVANTAVYLGNVLPSVYFVGVSLYLGPIANEMKVLIWDSDQNKISFYKLNALASKKDQPFFDITVVKTLASKRCLLIW